MVIASEGVSGLQLDDRICIIGGGMAGTHMAYLLKQKGFDDVVLIEQAERLGGKCQTKSFNQINYEMGASMVGQFYRELIELVSKHQLDELKPIGHQNRAYFHQGTAYRVEDLSLGLYRRPKWLRPFLKPYYAIAFVALCRKYIKVHRSIFGSGEYPYRIQPLPGQIDMTFSEFLQKHKLVTLTNFFRFTFGLQYDKLETVPALYVLWWCTPDLINSQLRAMVKKGGTYLYRFPNGMQTIVEKIAELSGAEILLDFQVTSVTRENKITVIGKKGSRPVEVHCDRLIVAVNAMDALTFLDSTDEEKAIFSQLKVTHPAMTVFKSESVEYGGAASDRVWFDTILPAPTASKEDGSANLAIEPARYFGKVAVNDQDEEERVYVTFQPCYGNPQKRDDEILRHELLSDLSKKGFAQPEILHQCRWNYFPRFSQADIDNGYPWKILEMQGRNNTWYIGSSVCFESLKDVMRYNSMVATDFFSIQRKAARVRSGATGQRAG